MAKPLKTDDQPIAKVFMSGPSQAVRLPQAYRFDCDQVAIRREGKALVLTPLPRTWDDLRVADAEPMREDFIAAVLDDRDLLPLEERAAIE